MGGSILVGENLNITHLGVSEARPLEALSAAAASGTAQAARPAGNIRSADCASRSASCAPGSPGPRRASAAAAAGRPLAAGTWPRSSPAQRRARRRAFGRCRRCGRDRRPSREPLDRRRGAVQKAQTPSYLARLSITDAPRPGEKAGVLLCQAQANNSRCPATHPCQAQAQAKKSRSGFAAAHTSLDTLRGATWRGLAGL